MKEYIEKRYWLDKLQVKDSYGSISDDEYLLLEWLNKDVSEYEKENGIHLFNGYIM